MPRGRVEMDVKHEEASQKESFSQNRILLLRYLRRKVKQRRQADHFVKEISRALRSSAVNVVDRVTSYLLSVLYPLKFEKNIVLAHILCFANHGILF